MAQGYGTPLVRILAVLATRLYKPSCHSSLGRCRGHVLFTKQIHRLTSMEETPLNKTKEEALTSPGEIYHHYKGGVYRLIKRDVKHSETGEIGVLYEHLRSQIFASPSLSKFRHPTSRFRLLTKHRCGFEMSENAKQIAFSVAFRPHNHGFWFRPQEMFFGKNEKGEERFKLVHS
ncbi:MAG: DUF1653 domain-containing protein [Minisyncoccia bacterium]